MRDSYRLLVWYEFREFPVHYEKLTENNIDHMIQRIKEMNAEPGLNNRAIRYEVEYIRREPVGDGVF